MTDNQTQSCIPREAYLFFPKDNKSASNPNAQRTLFDGNVQFTDHEISMINEFRSYAQKQGYTLKSLWTDNMILRFLYANNFKMNKTLASVQEHTTWRETALPVKVDEQLQKVLNSGLIYVHGRDHQFRPIVIFNVYMIDPKKVDVELITRALTFWFEHVINEWMLPGQVENWVFIADVKGMGAGTLALQSIRKLFAYLQENYKCRLHQLYILNVTPFLYAPWKMAKAFLDEVTVEKVRLCKKSTPTGLLASTNPEQIEQKYGGSAPNMTQYWPPVIPSNNYFVSPKDSEALISEDEYVSLYRNGCLKNMRIDHSRIMQTPQPIEENHVEILKQDSSSSSSCDDLSPMKPYSVNESEDNADNADTDDTDDFSDADYLDDMNETVEQSQITIEVREFPSTFLSNIASH